NPDPWPVPDYGTEGNPEFKCCKKGSLECCDDNRDKCDAMCAYWYDWEHGNIPNNGYYRDCLRCCKAKLQDCLKKYKHVGWDDCVNQGPHKPLEHAPCGA